MKNNNKITIYIFIIDFLTNIITWYIFIFLLNLIYISSNNILHFALFYILRLIASTVISFILSYMADIKGIDKIMKLILFTFFIITILPISNNDILYNLYFIYIILIIFEINFTLYNILKYSLVPKVSSNLERINSVYELSYSILMVIGPFSALILLRVEDLVPLIALIPSIIFSLIIDRIFIYNTKTHNLSDLNSILRNISENRKLIKIFIFYILLANVGSIVNLAIINISERLPITTSFIAKFSLINTLLGSGSLISSIVIIKNNSLNSKSVLLSWIILSTYPLVIFLLYYFNFSILLTYIFLAFSFLNGFFNSILSIFITSKIQENSKEYIATTFSIINFLSNIISILLLYIEGLFYRYILIILIISSLSLFVSISIHKNLG